MSTGSTENWSYVFGAAAIGVVAGIVIANLRLRLPTLMNGG